MKRLCWSKLFSCAAILSVAYISAYAATPTVQVGGGTTYSPSARIPAPYSPANPQSANAIPRAIFEGPNVTDYFNFERNYNDPANPQIAVGPSDLLLIVNRQIFRLPNGNNPGVKAAPLNPFATQAIGQGVAQKAFLDVWIGETALNALCPTLPRTAASCQFENTTTKYDQMHGRFLVLFTVTDTGLTQQSIQQGFNLTNYRKSSWVLLVSRFAILTDTSKAIVSNSDVFVTPTPPNGSTTGGVNSNLWTIVYGNALNALGSDNFGAPPAVAPPAPVPPRPDGGSIPVASAGNINALPGIGASADSFDCSPTAVYTIDTFAPAAGAAKVCYFPTAARLGIDNDTVTIVSPVVNVNINPVNLGNVYGPAVAPPNRTVPGYAGNRVRVIKKTRLYTLAPGAGGNVGPAGDQWTGAFAARAAGNYYDLYTSPDGLGAAFVAPTGGPTPYTALANYANEVAAGTNVLNGISLNTAARADSSSLNTPRIAPIFYEPVHLRGRTMATYSNSPALSNNGRQNSQTYLLGAVSSTASNNVLFVQGIRQIYAPLILGGGFSGPPQGPIPFFPVLQTGIFDNPADPIDPNGVRGVPYAFATAGVFTNPFAVQQQNYRGGGPAGPSPRILVGDNRPHAVIAREGHLYDARVGAVDAIGGTQITFSGSTVDSTVLYDITQKLHASTPAQIVVDAKWQNTDAYAPMFDVPANVSQAGQISPINLFPYLEKLFVATTYPPLAGFPDNNPAWNTAANGGPISPSADAANNPWGNTADPRSRDDSSNPKTALPLQANCYSYFQTPGNPLPPGQTIAVVDASNTSPIVITTAGVHNLVTGARVTITGVTGNTNANVNNNSITVLDASRFQLDGRNGNGAYVNGGAIVVTSNPQRAWPSLFDIRCGEDPYDTLTNQRNPVSGRIEPIVSYTTRGGASTDPNDGSIWAFGAYARKRLATFGTGQWGTFGANYKLDFPTTDPYGNVNSPYSDTTGLPEFGYIEIARRVGIVPLDALGSTFQPEKDVLRREMARWVVKSQMDEAAIDNYLANTPAVGNGGIGPTAASFADVPYGDPDFRYIEVMARRGYTSGCSVDGVAFYYCPNNITTRKDMAVFLIRAKLNNVFPTVLSGCPVGATEGQISPNTLFPFGFLLSCGSAKGDNFGLFVPGLAYFTDNTAAVGNTAFPFIQKMKELGITNGTYLGPLADARNGTYTFGVTNGAPPAGDPGNLKRKQIATFMVRAFFF